MPGDAGALAAGLVLGEDRHFSPAFRAAMRESATTHLVALSGFNVTILLGSVRRALRGRVSRGKEAACGIAFLGAFVLLAGFQPSLVRAAVMGSAVLLGGLLGRRVAPARLLLLTAAAMLLVEPRLATHLGFLLSFIASWALLATFGDMERILAAALPLRRRIAAACAPTLAAQAGVAPVLLATVGSVSLSGLIVNPLVLPLTPILTALAAGHVALSHSAPPLGFLLGPALALACAPVTGAIGLAARLPLQVAFALPAAYAVLMYAGSVAWSLRHRPRLW